MADFRHTFTCITQKVTTVQVRKRVNIPQEVEVILIKTDKKGE